jgi:hypothetical protein
MQGPRASKVAKVAAAVTQRPRASLTAIAQVAKMPSELVVADRVTIPQDIWVKPDGSVAKLDDFIGHTSRHPGVPVGSSRNRPTYRDWSACLQDFTLKPW